MACAARAGRLLSPACAVVPEFFVSNIFWRHELVVLLANDTQALIALLKLEHCDHACLHELSGEGSADQGGELVSTHRDVLLDLHDAKLVVAAFGLDRKHVVRSLLVHANINLVGFGLPHVRDGSPEMVL